MEKCELLILCEHMYTMEGEGVGYLADHGIAIKDGKIAAILPKEELKKAYTADRTIEAKDKMLMPGLIDGHMHTGHGVIRGVAQDISNWMMDGIAPFDAVRSTDAKTAGSRLTMAEAVLNGTTTLGEDGGDIEGALQFLDKIGARGNVSVRVRDTAIRAYKSGELYEYDDELGKKTLNEALTIFDKWHMHDGGRFRIRFGPQGADFVSLDLLKKVKDLALERKTRVVMHLEQGDRETKQMMMRHGKRSIPWLCEMGYLDENVQGIHLTSALPEEAKMAAESGATMILCSASIGIIDGIAPPVKYFQDAGGYAGLGSDQSPGNNSHNIFKEMYATALFNKLKFEDPEVMPAWKVLRMATVEGAKALGIGDITGSIKVGKEADLLLIDLRQPTMMPVITQPMRNFVPNLVYSAQGRDVVDTVIVKGRVLVENKKPLTFDMEEIYRDVQAHADVIGEKAIKQFNEVNGKNALYMREGKL